MMRWLLGLALVGISLAQIQLPQYRGVLANTAQTFTYYVDSDRADDSGNGLTPATAKKSIAAVNALTLTAGQSVGFKRGGTWRETLTPGQSGTAGHPITFGAYGSGAKPIISGSDLLASWTKEAVPVTQVQVYGTAGSVTNITTMPISASGSHNLIIVGVVIFNATDAITAISDNATGGSNTYVSAGIRQLNTTNSFATDIWYAKNTHPGATTISLTISPAANYRGVVWEVSGTDLATPLEAVNGVHSDATATQNPTGGAVITTASTSFIAANMAYAASTLTGIFGGNAFTNDKLTDGYLAGAHLITSSSGTYTPQWASSNTQRFASSTASFKSSGIQYYYSSLAADPLQIIEDSTTVLTKVSTKTELQSAAGTWWFDSGNNRLYLRTLDDTSPAGHTIEAGARTRGITITGKQNITISNLEVRGATLYGIDASGDFSNLTLSENTVRYSVSHGVKLTELSVSVTNGKVTGNSLLYNGSSGLELVIYNQSGWVVSGNTADHNSQVASIAGDYQFGGGLVVFCHGAGTGPIISSNTATNNGWVYASGTYYMTGVGIWSDTCNGTIISRNLTSGNRGPGIEVEKNNDSSVSYNISNGDALHGVSYGGVNSGYAAIHISVSQGINSTGNLVANNTVYNAGYAGIGVLNDNADATTISTTTVRNNIVINSRVFNLFAGPGGNNDTTHGSENVYTNNALGAPSATLAYWTGTGAISTYAGLDSAYGSAMGNVQADPLFTNAAAGDFTLQAGSPAIGAGVYIAGVSTANPPNIGAK